MAIDPVKARSIFLQALEEHSPQEWSAYLESACGGDVELRLRAEALLKAHAGRDEMLDHGIVNPPALDLTGNASGVNEGPGTVIGPYKLLEQIGEGGFGVVFMAEQAQPVRRRIALKIVRPGMDTRQVITRFEAERQALALMDHPNIARIFDGGATALGRPYFVMELVRGVPITDFCDQKHLPVRARLELFVHVCAAVQHAHLKGIIHRDLKPSNIMVTLHDAVPVVKVIDFGIAKAIDQPLTEKTLFTNFAQLIGTPVYMSPEQAQMNGLDIDMRSDIYSLGVLLYELLTGTTPFDKDRLKTVSYDEMRRIIREEEPARPSLRMTTLGQAGETVSANRGGDWKRLCGLLRGELDWIVMKTLDKDRTRRYETAYSLARDVQRYLRDEPVLACPPSAGYRLRKFARRNKGPVLAASLLGLALLAGIIGTTWGMIRATESQAVALNEARQKEVALAAALESERAFREQLRLALWNQARARRLGQQMGQRLDSLAAVAQAARLRPTAALRDEASAALALNDVRRIFGWRTAQPIAGAVGYGGQYRVYARTDGQEIISVRTIPEDLEIQRIASGPVLGSRLYFSADERFLLCIGAENMLRVWRVADGQPALKEQFPGCWAHAFSLDGRHLAVGQQDWALCFDLSTGLEVRRWRLPAPAHTMAFHPRSSQLAVGYEGSSVTSVYDAATGMLVADLPVGTLHQQVVAWHPDGERLAVAGHDARIQIWNLVAKRSVATLDGHVQTVDALTFHPDGELLASRAWEGVLLLWQCSSGRQLMRVASAVSAPHFSADGRWLGVAWNGNRADLLEVTASREYRTLVSGAGAGKGGYGLGDISLDGRLLAVGMDDGARLWDLRSGREQAALPPGTPYVSFDGQDKADESITHNSPRALLTCGIDGLLRWPIASNDLEGKRPQLGPPRQIATQRRSWFAHGPDGRTLGVVTEEGGPNKIVNLETGMVLRELGVHPSGEIRSLSGDGRWAASCGWHSDRVRLWNVGTGDMVREWVLGQRTSVFFTPDSRELIIARGDEFSFWNVETLQPIRRLPRDITQYPGWVAFSPDGRLMALEMAPAIIHLKDVATGRTVAKLEDPHNDGATWLGFTPDGTQLVVVASAASAVHIWDLRAIRKRLKEMNLDWDWPEFASVSKHSRPPGPTTQTSTNP